MKRNGDWIQTYSGLKMYPLDPRPEEISLIDIGHALSNICRFNGHTTKFYSVAQHSVFVSAYASRKNALWGLLHDASEAYLCDIASPVKNSIELQGYKKLERRVMRTIMQSFRLPLQQPKEITILDKIVLVTEARDLGLLTPEWKYFNIKPLKTKITPQAPEDAERSFFDWYNVITQPRMVDTWA